MGSPAVPRKRIWVQQVAVDADVLETRVRVARARGLTSEQQAVADGVVLHLGKARHAAFRVDPIPSRWTNWWRGTLVEAAYRNMHAAQADLLDLYDEPELRAEARAVLARAQTTLHGDDPRQVGLEDLASGRSSGDAVPELRARLRRLTLDSFAAIDRQHGQVRNFRNILLLSALVVLVLTLTTLVVVSRQPTVVPLCFPNEVVSVVEPFTVRQQGQNCPTRAAADGPSGGDVLIVALLGALGGALAAAMSIRNLQGTSTPYDVPVSLALLKFPLGAFTAVLALVAIQGDFVPGLTALDSQEQILAYALVFGFAQQALTRLLDQRAQTLLNALPSKDTAPPAPRPVQVVPPQRGPTTGVPPSSTGDGPPADALVVRTDHF